MHDKITARLTAVLSCSKMLQIYTRTLKRFENERDGDGTSGSVGGGREAVSAGGTVKLCIPQDGESGANARIAALALDHDWYLSDGLGHAHGREVVVSVGASVKKPRNHHTKKHALAAHCAMQRRGVGSARFPTVRGENLEQQRDAAEQQPQHAASGAQRANTSTLGSLQ